MPTPLTASELILSVLQIAERNAVSVALLIEVASRFEVSSNNVRVALTRLVKRGLVNSPRPTFYALADAADPVRAYLETWRLGEGRLREWDGTWLAIHLPAKPISRTARRQSINALTKLGLREARSLLWVRPDCLSEAMHPLATLYGLGLEADAEPLGVSARAECTQLWSTTLWDRRVLDNRYAEALQTLTDSQEHCRSQDTHTTLVRCFHTGRDVIRLLGLDPLLPPELVDADARAALTAAMLSYDANARALWRDALNAANLSLPGIDKEAAHVA
jgi:phenylacetic acid degradation operon negative regulatory protein